MLSYLQKVGRALMVPVAVLPAAALLMGIGYFIDPAGWGGESAVAALLIKAGASVIDNMSVLFAVGIAYGMSKDKDGAAAISGLVGFLVVTTLLSTGSVAMLKGIPASEVPFAFAKINNQFVGILVGIISAELYNKFSGIELHKALAFFSGRRSVPIIVSFVMILVSFVLLEIWPLIFGALQNFGESIVGLGEEGAGIYAFFNRLLIPVGLHHALNSVFWFDVAGINDIPNFLGGQTSIDAGRAIIGKTGMYQAGFFPIMMFGLPGGAFAIYRCAKPENKEKIASIMIAASLATFFTGVTEPLEFSFMFVAPVLYFVHAVLTGISVYIAASMQWMAGFGFSAGLVDMFLSSQNPLATKWYMLILQGIGFFAVYYFIFTALIKTLNLKTPGREENDETQTEVNSTASSSNKEIALKVLEIVGKDNLVYVDNCITRLRLEVKDSAVIDENELKKYVLGVVKPNKTTIQVIIGPHVEFVANELKTLVKK